MERLSELMRRFRESPDAVRGQLAPAVLVWPRAPLSAAPELVWHTQVRAARVGGAHEPRVYPLRKRQEGTGAASLGITLGRAVNNDVALDEPSVSRFHAYFQLEADGTCRLFDADSANGTLCNGVRVPPGGRGVVVPDMAVLAVGDVALHFLRVASFEATWLVRRTG